VVVTGVHNGEQRRLNLSAEKEVLTKCNAPLPDGPDAGLRRRALQSASATSAPAADIRATSAEVLTVFVEDRAPGASSGGGGFRRRRVQRLLLLLLLRGGTTAMREGSTSALSLSSSCGLILLSSARGSEYIQRRGSEPP